VFDAPAKALEGDRGKPLAVTLARRGRRNRRRQVARPHEAAIFRNRLRKIRPTVREDRVALDIELSSEDLDELDNAFPPPTHKTPLEMT
jgi:hypothetical protein